MHRNGCITAGFPPHRAVSTLAWGQRDVRDQRTEVEDHCEGHSRPVVLGNEEIAQRSSGFPSYP
jgi:hypothetical protein